MFDYYMAVTNRHLCRGDFLEQIEKITSYSLQSIILREKDLSPAAYEALARDVLEICRINEAVCTIHTHVEIARRLHCSRIHLPLSDLRKWSGQLTHFSAVGTSCHSLEEVLEAQRLGATYATLGNIFPTTCKPGLPGKGLDFLQKVCQSCDLPIYAIGGVNPGNIASVLDAGAVGGCMMSVFMLL